MPDAQTQNVLELNAAPPVSTFRQALDSDLSVIDPAVIRRSAKALPQTYGDDFHYDHRLCLPGIVRGGHGHGLGGGYGHRSVCGRSTCH